MHMDLVRKQLNNENIVIFGFFHIFGSLKNYVSFLFWTKK